MSYGRIDAVYDSITENKVKLLEKSQIFGIYRYKEILKKP